MGYTKLIQALKTSFNFQHQFFKKSRLQKSKVNLVRLSHYFCVSSTGFD